MRYTALLQDQAFWYIYVQRRFIFLYYRNTLHYLEANNPTGGTTRRHNPYAAVCPYNTSHSPQGLVTLHLICSQ